MAEANGSQAKYTNGAQRPMLVRPPPPAEKQAGGSRLTTGEITGRQVVFDVEELLVSKTDLKGHITYANAAFCRVAGFTETELMGQPHNVIRHPDMPRSVFNLLWKTIQSGREIFAYVVNLTKSGDHYWVLAHVTPTFDSHGNISGYHSNRRYADPAALAKVKDLYDKLLVEERGHARRADAIAAGTQFLERQLADLGTTYDEFIFSL